MRRAGWSNPADGGADGPVAADETDGVGSAGGGEGVKAARE